MWGRSRSGSIALLLLHLRLWLIIGAGSGIARAQLPLRSLHGDSDCPQDCDEESARSVCGTDGRTYINECEIKSAQCEGHMVNIKHYGECSESQPCFAYRRQLQRQVELSGQSVFIPECNNDGTYAQVQCHDSSGYCFCMDKTGKVIQNTSVKNKKPNCSQVFRKGRRRFGGFQRAMKSQAFPTTSTDKKQPFRRRESKRSHHRRGCSNIDRTTFNDNIKDIFRSEFSRLPTVPTIAPRIISDSLIDTQEKKVIQYKFTELDNNNDDFLQRKEVRDLRRMVKRIVRPRACAKTFTRYCDLDQDRKISRVEWSVCLGVDINNEHQGVTDDVDIDDEDEEEGNIDGNTTPGPPNGIWAGPEGTLIREKGPDSLSTESSEDIEKLGCLAFRRNNLDAHRQSLERGIYIPKCTPEGLYEEVQCHESTKICWCVNPKTGRPIPGTALSEGTPDCEAARKNATFYKGCSYKRKQNFLHQLINTFAKEMDSSGNSSHNEDSSMSRQDEAVRWKFSSLDSNHNKVLDRKEWKSFRKEWKTFRKENKERRKFRKCWRNFLRYCDANNDKKTTLDEWLQCTGTRKVLDNSRKGSNPFKTLLHP